MDNETKKHWFNPELNRRSFLKVSGILASSTLATSAFTKSKNAVAAPTPGAGVTTGETPPDPIETADDIIYSVCQMCHSRCGVRAKVKEGILVKLDGNPYHPNNRDVDENMQPDRLPYNTSSNTAFRDLGRMCLKGQAGLQTVYDPYRVQHPLKRVGARNSGQWESISWEQAFAEIAAKINQLIPPSERDEDIDPARPELGKKRNQLAFAPGRSVEKEMSERIWKHAWGTANYGLSHTSVCESSRHVANELITWDPKGSKTSMGGGRTEGWQADILGSEFIIYFGANPLEADFPMVGMARDLMEMKRHGGKFVTVDPRLNNTGAKANQWVPITPGTDAALAMAMISWIISNNAYDAQYLSNPNKDAATAGGEPTWSDSTYLVGTFTATDGKQFQRYINAKEAGISNGATVMDDDYVVWSDGAEAGHSAVLDADLEVSQTLNLDVDGTPTDVDVKSAFTLLKEQANSKSLSQYATITDISVGKIVELASEFVSHGKKAAAITYRGPIKHTNGLYNQLAIQHLNTLIGNYDWKGGCTAGGGGWSHKSGVVSLSKVAGDPGNPGIRLDRAKTFYNPQEAGSLFTGYPAKRPWFPFGTHGNYQEVIPSVADGYPYPMKVMITYWNAWPYSVPSLRKVWEQTLADESKLPLLVTISPVIGEVAAWADYILPDSVYLEKFSFPGIPWRVNKGSSFQQPIVGSYDGQAIGSSAGAGNSIPNGANNYTPALPDTKAVLDIHIGLAKALGLPGVGVNALLDDGGNPVGDLHNSWDWAKAMLSNLEANTKGKYPGITVNEIVAKGGVFDNPTEEYTGEQLSYQYGNIIRTFIDPIARTKDSVTGFYYSGVPQYLPIVHSNGAIVNDSAQYPLRLITYKTVHHGQARTNVNPWLMLMIPENPVEINPVDASALGLETGDTVNIASASHSQGIEGRALITERIKPGVIAVSHHYGHWEQGSRAHQIDGVTADFDASRGAGLQPNEIMRTDNQYPNASLQEPLGASCSFYDTDVRITKV